MRGTLIILLVVLFALMGAAAWKGQDTFTLGLRTSGVQLLRFLPILVIAMLLAGFAEALLPPEIVNNWLSDASGWRGIGVAWLAGILTPGGSVMGMPLVAALYKVGAGIGVLITYLTAMALMSVIRIPLKIGFYGWRLTLLRIAACLFLPPLAGILAQIVAPLFLKQ